jgi:predicted porin
MYVTRDSLASESSNAWSVAARASLRFTERFGLDAGINYLDVDGDKNPAINSVTTLWVAPKIELTQDIGLRGAVYFQSNSYGAGHDFDSSPMAWKVVLDVRQDLLKFTSVWLEYDRLERNFVLVRGGESLVLSDTGERDFFGSLVLGGDLSVWRIGLNQVWNDRWSSWIYYARYDFSGYPGMFSPTDPTMDEISAGIEYRLNAHTTFTLAYFYHKFNGDAFLNKNRTLLFRASIWF